MNYNTEDDEDYVCYHGFCSDTCNLCRTAEDELIEANGGIDKCMNCGKYKYNKEFNKDQVYIKPCRNPMEY